ncbi:PIG-L deacetylase family protein [Patescibacteria group bacterium]
MKTMLLVFAHPDDESFSCGITVSKYAANGWNVQLICITNGQKGTKGPYEEADEEGLGNIRKTELEDAARILGISEIDYLDYHDGNLKKVESGELEDILYRKMVEISPQIVITSDPTGISNHPDHIKTCYSTTYAFQKYTQEIAQARQFVEDVNNEDKNVKIRHFYKEHKFALQKENFTKVVDGKIEPKLYYACMPQSVAEFLLKKNVLPEESFGSKIEGTPDDMITTVIEGKNFVAKKKKALKKHISQTADIERFFGISNNPLSSKEYFILRMHGYTEVFMGKNDKVRDRL